MNRKDDNGTIANALTIDVEDWHQLVVKNLTGKLGRPSGRLPGIMDLILDLLESNDVRCTFFVLGIVAENHPDLVRRIAAAGHEVATHGYAHDGLRGMSEDEFAKDIQQARDSIEAVIGVPPVGYRAPAFSVDRDMPWVFHCLRSSGFSYDSSVFPILHRRYGIPGAPRRPYTIETPSGLLREFPLATARFFGWNLPVAGGGYFRLLPYIWIRSAIRAMNRAGMPAVLYVHPYEFDPKRLRIGGPEVAQVSDLVKRRVDFLQNLGRGRVIKKVRRLLTDFRFQPLREWVSFNGNGIGNSGEMK